ncbi:hypothetical protein C7H19_15680 [Aphanothece hegewaldii CCALA 016]|uniref:Uncharacterized protein n=1 Tax=Aphanothece hegewaldii CCALA 016 TaxID=2107694 RepID=A0A2T1LVD7_9CHRO|nr:hypothetical protein [Aphanothece hegewaldii]PSF35677.1 hypothetical protein C7H19_15680 [Aphanothece hegewaldii CCALA 016]
MSEEEIRNLVASNAKAIAALTQLANEILPRVDEMQRQIESMQRQHLDALRRTNDHSADIRELTIENQRILRYLEKIVNRSESN